MAHTQLNSSHSSGDWNQQQPWKNRNIYTVRYFSLYMQINLWNKNIRTLLVKRIYTKKVVYHGFIWHEKYFLYNMFKYDIMYKLNIEDCSQHVCHVYHLWGFTHLFAQSMVQNIKSIKCKSAQFWIGLAQNISVAIFCIHFEFAYIKTKQSFSCKYP